MQSNVQMTPAVADIGAAMVQAVLAVLADPKGAAETVKLRAEAVKLSEEALEQLAKDRAFMVETAQERERLADWESAQAAKQADLDASWRKLGDERDVHTRNVETFGESQRKFNSEAVALAEAQRTQEAGKKAFEQEWKKLVDAQEAVKKREGAVTRREEVLRKAAEAVAA